jgi:UDP-N-acetylmuramoylalanine--D-glutamate ligase
VLNADDPWTRGFARHAGAPVWFSLSQPPPLPVSEIPLRGSHNVENVMAAAAICKLAGATDEQIRAAVRTFPGVEHRLEFVRTLDGVDWYNDSKATNVDASLKAIAAFDGGLWIILGGKDKNSDYRPLAEALQGKTHVALLIGAAAQKIEQHLGGAVMAVRCGDIARAIAYAHEYARGGDTVLLAPACASFDQFDNYEHRGREFKRLVHALGGPPSR